MAEKQLIVAVEGTAALGPYWPTILSDYLEKIIRSFCGNDISSQKPTVVSFELALVMFTSHGSYCASLVQRSGWTRDIDIFLQWLSAIPFGGGGFNDAAIAEGLAEALMMFAPNGSQTQQNVEVKKHCVLVSASNPYPLPTPIYRPKFQSSENEVVVEAVAESRLSDAETIAKSYSQGFVSLSVICPKQLPKLRAIFNAGKRNPRSPDPPIDNKNPHSLVLVSENFMEARAALSRSGVSSMPSTQSPIKMDISQNISVSGPPPASLPAVNGVILNRQPVPVGNGPTAIVKVEPTTVTSMAAAPTFPHVPPVQRATPQVPPVLQTSSPPVSQEASGNADTAQDMKPVVSGGLSQQPTRPAGPANSNILNNLSQVRQVVNSAALTGGTSIGLQTMNQNPMAMHVSNMISSGMQSSIPAAQNVYSSGQSGVTSMAGSGTGAAQVAQNPALSSFAPATSNMSGNSNLGMSQPTGNLQVSANMAQNGPQMVGINQNIMNGLAPAGSSAGNGSMMPTPGMTQGMQSMGGGNNPGANMSLSQQSSSAMQTAQSKYVKVWEGNLSGQRQGQPVFITRLEGYRSASASETLAANWPPTMQIVRLISQDHMNNKQYVGKADFLVFRAMNQHGFLGQLQEKKLCAVIQLPSQTLLLSVSDKACRLIGMLFPGDMVVFKPQMPSQQQQQQQQLQQQQQQPMQMQQQQPMQMQQQQPMQMQQQQQPMQMQQQQQPMQMQQQQQPMQMQQQQQPMQMQQQQQPMQMQQQQPMQMPQLQQQQQMPQLQQQQQMPQLQQQQQMPQLQQQQPQLNQIQQQQRPPQQQAPQPMVGVGGGYVQGPPRAQLVPQSQIPSQGPNSLPGGGGFIN